MLIIHFCKQLKRRVFDLKTVIVCQNYVNRLLCFYIWIYSSIHCPQLPKTWRLMIQSTRKTKNHIGIPVEFYGKLSSWTYCKLIIDCFITFRIHRPRMCSDTNSQKGFVIAQGSPSAPP